MTEKSVHITVPTLTRVEGEGALDLVIEKGKIEQLRLRIYEPPRYFEKFLEGRSWKEVPDIVARICGICPVAYQMSAVQAMEQAFSVEVSDWVRNMRRVMYCGEWIQSHSLHIHLLAAPDFLGFNDAIGMATKYPDEVRRGLALQAIGNELIALFGGRSVHPVGTRVGGFYHAPSRDKVNGLLVKIRDAIPEAEVLVKWTASIDLPDDDQEFISVAMRHEADYPLGEGKLVSSDGLDIGKEFFDQHFKEQHVPHSTALHCLYQGKPYLVGPLARLNLNLDRLPQSILGLLEGTGIQFPSNNTFHSIVARAIELLYCLVEAERLLSAYEETDRPYVEFNPSEGEGYGCTEAPRGVLWHHYHFNEKGEVMFAQIVPPTSQNQARIEQDLHDSLVKVGLGQDDDVLRFHAEKVIRNYDPCISCATHFLKLSVSNKANKEIRKHQLSGRVCLIAIGSPGGNDSFAWDVADAILSDARFQQSGWLVKKLDRPGTQLLNEMSGEEQVIILDAMTSPAASGKLVINSWHELQEASASYLSGHDLGVMPALKLGESLGQLPEKLLVAGMLLQDTVDEMYSVQDVNEMVEAIYSLKKW